jgi:uncharacterized membrane protein YoaK (UPF0700 family)
VFGYVAAVLLPILGVVLGIIVATRPKKANPRHGIQIIILSVAIFALAVLLAHR